MRNLFYARKSAFTDTEYAVDILSQLNVSGGFLKGTNLDN